MMILGKGLFNKLMLAMNTVWSRKYYKAIAQIIKDEEPDLVHFTIYFHRYRQVFTRHAMTVKFQRFKHFTTIDGAAPAGTFFRDGKPCELHKCGPPKFNKI